MLKKKVDNCPKILACKFHPDFLKKSNKIDAFYLYLTHRMFYFNNKMNISDDVVNHGNGC